MFRLLRALPFVAALPTLFFLLVAYAQPATSGPNVRVSNADFFPADPFASAVGGPADVLQQNEPHIVQSPLNASVLAVGMNDVRTLGISDDAWQGLAISTNGGATWGQEQLVPGWPGDDRCPDVSPLCGTAAGSDPVLGFDRHGHLYYSMIAFHRAPPGQPGFKKADANAVAVAKYNVHASGHVAYDSTSIVERGNVGLGRQEDKEWLTVDNSGGPNDGNVYVCWARFTGNFNHLAISRSTDQGETWSEAAIVDNGTAMQGCQLTVAPDGTLYVIYRKFRTAVFPNRANFDGIFAAKSTDGGLTFSEPVLVSPFTDYFQAASRTPPQFRTFTIPSAAADSNGVYVAWTTKNDVTGGDIEVAFSHDGGATWTKLANRPHTDAAPRLGHQLMPAISTGGGTLSIIWYDSRSEPAFVASGPVTGSDDDAGPGCDGDPDAATPAAPEPDDAVPGCGMDVFYNQIPTAGLTASTAWGGELRLTAGSWNPNLWGSIKAITPFIGDYIAVVSDATSAYAVWADNRDINAERQRCDEGEDPAAGECEDANITTDPPALINARSRDANIYFQRVTK